jgi:hypothetical protein
VRLDPRTGRLVPDQRNVRHARSLDLGLLCHVRARAEHVREVSRADSSGRATRASESHGNYGNEKVAQSLRQVEAFVEQTKITPNAA